MRKETHTPGPWVMQERKDGMGSLPNRNSIEIVHNYAGGEGQQVIVGKHTGIDCLSKTNAQLIAAAPDMLKELEGCLRVAKAHYLDMVDQYTDDDPDIEEHLRHAHPNIAAAAMEVKRLETIIYKATGDV